LKDFRDYLQQVTEAYPHCPWVVERTTRTLRVKIINQYVQKSLCEVHLLAHKTQALQSCQRIRHYNQYLLCD
jgi:uncharacterized protein with HEPN domain